MNFLQTNHAVYSLFSTEWSIGIGIFVMYSLLVIAATKLLRPEQLRAFEKIWGLALIALLVGKHFHLAEQNLWSVEDNLELHLCGFSRMLSILLLAFGVQWAFYPLFFWGIVGGFYSLITPELTGGDSTYMFIEYYIVHGGIIIIPLYYFFVRGMRIGRRTWLKVIILNLILMVPIGLANHLTGGNYMFLCQAPEVDNPLIIGKWPYYVFWFILLGSAHYVLLTGIFWKSIKKAEKNLRR
tara:strand:- start:1064 stop:1783 length:720 start_codon:yes stop_codon:yes gene_type:complete